MPIYNPVKVLALSFLILSSCSKSVRLENFDTVSWSSDLHGCKGSRGNLVDQLLNQKDQLLARDEMEIVAALGKPDAHEIYKRSEKFFYYSVDPDSTCTTPAASARKLIIRFNAIGRAREVILE